MATTREQRERLIEIAERAIRDGALGGRAELDLSTLPAWAAEPAATFVTVYLDGELNGCIGTLEPRRALAADIANNAQRAAFGDPRFPEITVKDLDRVSVHIAILGELIPVEAPTEHALIEQMRPGVDGIVLEAGTRRGTFLPAVWEGLPDPAEFLAHLKQKARLQPDEWPEDLEVYRFEVEDFDRDSIRS